MDAHTPPPSQPASPENRRLPGLIVWLAAATGLVLAALFLAWAASGFQQFNGWQNLLAALLLGAGILWLGWRSLAGEHPPNWLAVLLLLAAGLRLGLGVLWYTALPAWGYQNPVERAGYVMQDAYERDTAAWELAASDAPLWRAFNDYRASDQYGGLLFLSALLYRTLGGPAHQPLMMVAFGAAFSALAVLYTWAAARRLVQARAADLAAWGLAFYPEAVLLGSSQMREAYTITLAVMALYGLLRYHQDRRLTGLFFLLGALLTCLVISPPAAVLILFLLLAVALTLDKFRLLRSRRLWLILVCLTLLAGVVLWLAWGQIAPEGVSSPPGMVSWWLRKAADLQAYETRQASGWIQKIFRETPAGLHLPMLVVYGAARPLLPAALVAGGAPIWRGIAIWRALGWSILLFLLLYALWVWLRDNRRTAVMGALQLVVWVVILVASLRSGGDQWDNPRYRATLAGVQVMIAAWGLVAGRQARDPWFRRALIGALLVIAWFIPWYLRRYTPLSWPVVDPFKTLGLGLISASLYFLWDWARQVPAALPETEKTG
jgi:hypothetical protein